MHGERSYGKRLTVMRKQSNANRLPTTDHRPPTTRDLFPHPHRGSLLRVGLAVAIVLDDAAAFAVVMGVFVDAFGLEDHEHDGAGDDEGAA